MSPAQLSLFVVAAIGLFNAAFFSVVAYELTGHSMIGGIAGAVVILVAESILVKVMGAKIFAKLNEGMEPSAE
jgi:uncharacterized membrane protein